jgi:hypothetical protein
VWLWLETRFGLEAGFIGRLHSWLQITTRPRWVTGSKLHCNYSTHKVFYVAAGSNGERSPSSVFPKCPRLQLSSSEQLKVKKKFKEPGYLSRYSDWLRVGRKMCRSSNPDQGKNLHSSMPARPALGSTEPPIQWVTGAVSPGVKRTGREAVHSTPTSVEVKKISSWRSA